MTSTPSPLSPDQNELERHTATDGKGILITTAAMQQLAALVDQQGGRKLLRVGVRSGGCSGMSYTMDFISEDQVNPDDEQYSYQPNHGPSFAVVWNWRHAISMTSLKISG